MAAPSPASSELFKSEATWPLTLRASDIADCEAFLGTVSPRSPRHLHVAGPSGSGKSFLVRELLVRRALANAGVIAIYLDAPPSDLEASALLDRLGPLLSKKRTGDRAAPNTVPRNTAVKWRKRRTSKARDLLGYLYRMCRDLSGHIPLIGPVTKAVLPVAIPSQAQMMSDPTAALRFLISQSYKSEVVLAIDNVQFVPEPLRDLIEIEVEQAGACLRLITVERCQGAPEWPMMRECAGFIQKNIELGAASLSEIRVMAREALRDHADLDLLAQAIFRRSAGNLKSAWFQMKLLAERREISERLPGSSYERVIGDLSPVDQIVLRLVVFVLGGLSVGQIVRLFKAIGLHVDSQAVTLAIADLAALGLLVVNGEQNDRVRVEHELVAQTVHALTPEEEKLEFRTQLVRAISAVLDAGPAEDGQIALYDRLLGIAGEQEFRSDPTLQSHLVTFVCDQYARERHTYLAALLRDSVCWSILDLLPGHVVRLLLDAIQKSSAFSLGLVTTQKLRTVVAHQALSSLYEAKYLVQLFQYDQARAALERAQPSPERDAIQFNMLINECEDELAGRLASELVHEAGSRQLTEYECVMLRNAGHLFGEAGARQAVTLSFEGFRRLGLRFGSATAQNNLGIVELLAGNLSSACTLFETALSELTALGSHETYQPLVNLAAAAFSAGDIALARRYLRRGQELAPSSLPMDMIMFAFNDGILELASGGQDGATLESFRNLHRQAVRTRDLRFAAILGAFTADLEIRLLGLSRAEFDTTLIERVQDSDQLGIEMFRDVELAGAPLSAPFILSPHWRY